MKTNFRFIKNTLFIIIFLISSNLFSQEIKMEKEELAKVLCKSWRINRMLVNGEEVLLSESFLNTSNMEFKTDHTYLEKPVTDKTVKGIWNYNVEKHCVELFMENKLIGTIKSVDLEKLVYIPFLDEDAKKFMKSAEMHLSPAN